MVSKVTYKAKLKSKFLLYELFGVVVLLMILAVSVIANRFIETAITILLFFIYRKLYDKQYHSKSLILCGVISLFVFTIISFIEVKLAISITFSVVLTFLITTISFLVRDYLDSKEELADLKVKPKKCLENLTLEEMYELIPSIKKEIILITYEYLHRERSISACAYARSKNISEPLVYKYVKKVKDTYKSL